MAPQKTMAISSQQQQQQTTISRKDSGDQMLSAKARKRKQQAVNSSASQQQDSAKQQQQANSNGKLNELSNNNIKENLALKNQQPIEKKSSATTKLCQQQQQAAPTVVPSERTNLNRKQQQQNQVPTPEKKAVVTEKKSNTNNNNNSFLNANTTTILAKQLSDELADDIDAGIELDGSSNSGSSVKDLNEEQGKSTSVSPIMAQSNLVNENNNNTTRHAIEVAPLEQLTGSLCTDVAPSSKKISSTKQQLAANQQVIDADEQQLQQKLQNKQQQRKSLTLQTANTSLTNISANGTSSSNTSQSQHNTSTASAAAPTTPQSPALCKVCGQHVYQMERMLAEKSVYHKSCFRCYQCKIQLRVDNYSSHEGQVYCKAHHRQLFQPQVRLDSEDDVDIVAKSTTKAVDDYLTHRGRLSELSFSFLQTKPEGIRKRQMIICENEPAELPKDVVRCDTKVDDGIDQLKLNLNNILEKFERGSASNGDGETSQPSSAGIVIEKPSFNIKKTLMAFETKSINPDNSNEDGSMVRSERPVVKKLTNSNGFLNRQNSVENQEAAVTSSASSSPATNKPLAIRRSESLMQRLKKYESRIAGEQVVDDEEENDGDGQDQESGADKQTKVVASKKQVAGSSSVVPKKLTSINLWESGDIKKRIDNDDDDGKNVDDSSRTNVDGNLVSSDTNGNSPLLEKQEELSRIRQQLACRKTGGESGIKNIYENAIREAQLQQQTTQQASRRQSSDLLALNGFSTSEIQQQLLQQNGSNQSNNRTPTKQTNKDHFQLNFNNKANKLKERFEQGLINNSQDDSDEDNDGNEAPAMTKLDQIRQEKLEDLSVFTEGEIKAREARSMFQQIDRRLSAASGGGQNSQAASPSSRSLSSISASMRTKLLNQMNSNDAAAAAAAASKTASSSPSQATNNCTETRLSGGGGGDMQDGKFSNSKQPAERQPIRLTNNVGK